jgi:hypothetical protein
VLTVPAVWHDGAKGFMRNAAFLAGCVALPRGCLHVGVMLREHGLLTGRNAG